jgi:hypothetical protein
VLAAAGHAEPEALKRRRQPNPGGLSRREVEVLQLAAKGLTTQGIAEGGAARQSVAQGWGLHEWMSSLVSSAIAVLARPLENQRSAGLRDLLAGRSSAESINTSRSNWTWHK